MGGGIVIIVSKTLTITGAINVNGDVGYTSSIPASGGGGGGAGGAVLLKGKTLTIGTNLITVALGAGGNENADGGAGSVGRIHADYSISLTGTTTPTIDSTLDLTIKERQGGAFLYNFI